MAWVHVLYDQDYTKRTATCEACGPVTIRMQGGWWRCREGLNARRAAAVAPKRGDREHARGKLADFLIQSGIPDADRLSLAMLTVDQADWLYWVVRSGVNAIADRHAYNQEGHP